MASFATSNPAWLQKALAIAVSSAEGRPRSALAAARYRSSCPASSFIFMSANFHCSPWNRSEEHTSELQSPCNLVCRLLLEKKKIANLGAGLVAHRAVAPDADVGSGLCDRSDASLRGAERLAAGLCVCQYASTCLTAGTAPS